MKPSIPKGTRDFLPQQVAKRNYIFSTIRTVFEKFGFVQIETPAMEVLSTLTGKYGEEGDKLLFKILNNGDYLAKADAQALEEKNSNKLLSSISKRGLRYDLTVPFARYVVMHQNDLYFPFKRYQLQPVWRADRPQKGRYQEFYQCDADVVGSDSLTYEAELIQILNGVFNKLGLDVSIKLNNRKILFGLAEVCGLTDRFMDLTIAVDKLDKIGLAGVKNILVKKEVSEEAIEKILEFLTLEGLSSIKAFLSKSETGQLGIKELEEILAYLPDNINNVELDVTLARGLNYYTGCIIEVVSNEVKIGSISGGGRYDDLTASFGLPNMSGVGVSFGAARIYDVLEELDRFPEAITQGVKVLVCPLDEDCKQFAFNLTSELRDQGIPSDMYPTATKMAKQLKYADKRSIPYAIIIGSNEMASGKLSLKDLMKGEQKSLSSEEIIRFLSK